MLTAYLYIYTAELLEQNFFSWAVLVGKFTPQVCQCEADIPVFGAETLNLDNIQAL